MGREMVRKRWRGQTEVRDSVAGEDDATPTATTSAAGRFDRDFSLPRESYASAASYRHSLLPEGVKEAYNGIGVSGMVVLSLSRLETFLSMIKT